MRTVLVTGGAGYVGSHCCKQFAAAGWRVVVYDDLSRGWRDCVKWGPLYQGDIQDQARLREVFDEVRPDAVAHFAALAYVGESFTNPASYYRVNAAGTLALLEVMLEAGVDRLLFSSTCATYGQPVRLPIDEAHPQKPINPYGWSKLHVEQMLTDFCAAYGMRYIALRYFNAAGADIEGEIGERHRPETHVIPLALEAALVEGKIAFTINGGDFDTRDGTAVRDYIHVRDLADGHARALDYLIVEGRSTVVNLGTGTGTSVGEIASAVERVCGVPLTRVMGPRRPGDPAALVAAAGRAETLLGWKPRYSDIDTIMESAWRWHVKDRRLHPL